MPAPAKAADSQEGWAKKRLTKFTTSKRFVEETNRTFDDVDLDKSGGNAQCGGFSMLRRAVASQYVSSLPPRCSGLKKSGRLTSIASPAWPHSKVT